jgi:hypothetical protein
MAQIKDPVTITILIAVLAIALLIVCIYLIRKGKQKKDRLLLDAYGRIPGHDDSIIENVDSYHKYFASSIPNDKRIDLTTWNDLNMDDVFARINVCSSTIGEEYLFHILHELEHDEGRLKQRERLVEWFDEHTNERLAAQKVLLGIGKRKNNSLSYYIFNAAANKIRYAWLFVVMALLPVAGLLLMPFFLIPGIALAAASVIANIVIYYVNSLKLETELEGMKHFSSLLFGAKALLRKAGRGIKDCGFDLESAIRPFKRKGGMIPGRSRQALAELEALTVIFKAVFLIDLIRYNHTINAMAKNKSELNELYCIVGEMDTAICIASFRQSLKHYCLPEFHNEKSIVFQDMYHPLLREPVTNSGKMDNSSIITGSNASGKSTFIKGLAVNNILAQTIHTCCAKRYCLKFSYVATSMALRDDIVSGESYFVAEIKSLKRIVAFTRAQYCTCFIDEILRGTNTRERIAASTAVLKLLHETGSLCVVASHDIELTEILSGVYDNYHFSEQIIGNAIDFDYLLKDGPSRTTNAIRLLEYMGFDKRIVDEATELLKLH